LTLPSNISHQLLHKTRNQLKKILTPVAKRQAAVYLQTDLQVSQRRACRLLGLHRSTARLVSRRKEDSVLLERLKQLAAERPRFGYRRLTTLLRREGMLVNPKKVSGREVVQLETAMGAAIGCFERARALRVPRSRFAPKALPGV